MKKITFKVESKKDRSVVSLLVGVHKISCRIKFDFKSGLVMVEDVEDNMINDVIDLVEEYYIIESIDIDNTADISDKKQEVAVKNEEDLEIKKIEFQNEQVEEAMNKLLKTIYWQMFKKHAQEKYVIRSIYTYINEISMRYSPKKNIDFVIGDIVEVDFGYHLDGEVNGSHVWGVVCDVLNDDMVFVAPITKSKEETTSRFYLKMETEDVTFYYDYQVEGIALIDKARYINVGRLKSVIGRTKPKFFEDLLGRLAFAFDFRDNPNSAADSEEQIKRKKSVKKVGSEETALNEMLGDELNLLDSDLPVSEQIEPFLNLIGMNEKANLVVQAFNIACNNVGKINYQNIVSELYKLNPNISEEIIKVNLKNEFGNWLEKYPELQKKCPKISLMSVLKVFAKRF